MNRQEQIEKMARTMCGYCSTDDKCAVSKNGREPDICANVDTQHCLYKEHAEELIENGYGDVSEYKAEIERLKTEKVKQAQIDVLNNVKDVLTNQKHECLERNNLTGYSAICECEKYVDELIKEVEK